MSLATPGKPGVPARASNEIGGLWRDRASRPTIWPASYDLGDVDESGRATLAVVSVSRYAGELVR